MIVVKNLKFFYKTKEILNDINFAFKEKNIYCIVGENGAGKTTLLELMLGLKKIQQGSIKFNEQSINEKLYADIGVVFQENILRPRLKVKDEINAHVHLFKASKEWETKIIETFELDILMNKIGNSLSGGERRRVLMAIAFLNHPKYLILDEPFTGIDTKIRNKLRTFMQEYVEKYNAIIIFSEHNILECQKYDYHFIFLYKGNTLLTGKEKDIRQQLKEKYNFESLEKLYLDIWKGECQL